MKELSVSQAQKQFTAILSETVTVVDKKSHLKKAVIMPYALYERLVVANKQASNVKKINLDRFVGLLEADFSTDDVRYNAIVK